MLKPNEHRCACRGCHGGCVHILTVEDGRITGIRPDPDSPLNKGRACVKGMTLLEQMYHPDRLLYPMKRVGPRGSDQWERISWDEAYDCIVRRLTALSEQYGPESIALFSGTGRHLLAQFWRFANVLGTPNAASSGALICLGPRKNAGDFTVGHFAGVDYFTDNKPAGILVWGANPAISGADGEVQWNIKDAAKAGTPLIVVDPLPNELTRQAEIWLKPRPGSDGALALGLLHVIIEEALYDRAFVEQWTVGFDALRAACAEYTPARTAELTWVPEEDILRAARRIAEIKPLSLEWGCAIEQTTNSFQTCRAVFLIPCLTGNYDIPGGFVESMELEPGEDLLLDRLPPERLKQGCHGSFPLTDGSACLKNFAHPWLTLDAMRADTDHPYRIRAMLAHANNTLLSVPDSLHTRRCLEELDFFVYMDFFKTPTAQMADILLPAALWPELDSLYPFPEFGDAVLVCQQKLVQTGECKSDEDFFRELSQRMGLDYGAASQRELLEANLREFGRRYPEFEGLTFDQFREMGYAQPERVYKHYEKRGRFDTPSGKLELYSQRVADAGCSGVPVWEEPPESPYSRPDLLEQYPLVLTTGGRRQEYFISNNRQIRSLRKRAPFPLVKLHPDTAARYGIGEGDWVWIETPRGKITQKACLVPEMDPRVVNCEMGWWYPEAGAPDYGWAESNANVLTVGALPGDPFNGAYTLRGLLCRVEKNPGCTIEARYHAWMGE